jgi:hypothetical protein
MNFQSMPGHNGDTATPVNKPAQQTISKNISRLSYPDLQIGARRPCVYMTTLAYYVRQYVQHVIQYVIYSVVYTCV